MLKMFRSNRFIYVLNVYKRGIKVKRINFYEKRYHAMDEFYSWVDQGSPYDIAVDQGSEYNSWKEDIDEIIYYVTIASRYARGGRQISNSFKRTLESIIPRARALNLAEYGLTQYEIECFEEDILDAAGYLQD